MRERHELRDRVRNQDAVRITTAPLNRGDDIAARQRRYLFSMTLRMLCFLGALLVGGWLRWVLVVGAVVLPYIAVVMANAAAGLGGARDLPAVRPYHHELGRGRDPLT